MKGFASDNYSGAHPEVLRAMVEANDAHAVAYGADPWSDRARELLRHHFGEQAQSFLVWNGTGANVCILRAMCRPWQAVVCAESAHINVDEGGAPEFLAGTKLLDLPTTDGKLTPELVERAVIRVGDEHAVQARVISITQSTELGTLYTVEEIRALADFAHANGMYLHVDGARLANAAAALGLPLRAFTTDAGVDAVSFGGTKNGMVERRGGGAARAASWPRGSNGSASSRCSSPRRVASSPRSSSRCSRTTSGCARPSTPTRWAPAWPRRSTASTGSA